MTRTARRLRLLAACMAALAGFVDALGYLQLQGSFVSFMSGNSTRLSIGLVADRAVAETTATLIALFVGGVVAGTVVTRRAVRRRPMWILLIVAVLLAVAASCSLLGRPLLATGWMTFAMGAENVAFERDGEVSIGLTYMTGTLVKFGQRLVAAFGGGDRWAWAWHLLLWLGLVGGAAAGAASFRRYGLDALWFATAAATALALVARFAVPVDARAADG